MGRIESNVFDPERWKPNYPNPAFLSRRPDDEYWAAKIVLAFTDEDIRALVETGEYSDPRVVDYLVTTLAQRRDKIGRTYFSKVLPLDSFRVRNGELLFEDLAVQYKFRPALEYRVSWSKFDNGNGTLTPLPEETSFRLPSRFSSLAEGDYFAARIHALTDERKTVTVYLRKKGLPLKLWALKGNGNATNQILRHVSGLLLLQLVLAAQPVLGQDASEPDPAKTEDFQLFPPPAAARTTAFCRGPVSARYLDGSKGNLDQSFPNEPQTVFHHRTAACGRYRRAYCHGFRTAKCLPNTPDQIKWSQRVSNFGAVYTLGFVTGGLLVGGKVIHKPHLSRIGRISAEALANAVITNYALKGITQRERPNQGNGDGRFWAGGQSFPSGHAMNSWAVAIAVARNSPMSQVACDHFLRHGHGSQSFALERAQALSIGHSGGRRPWRTHRQLRGPTPSIEVGLRGICQNPLQR